MYDYIFGGWSVKVKPGRAKEVSGIIICACGKESAGRERKAGFL